MGFSRWIGIIPFKGAVRLSCLAFITLALAGGLFSDPALALVGSNSFCNSYVIPSAGTGGTVSAPLTSSAPPPTGTTTCAAAATGGGTTTATSLTTVGGKLEANEQLVPLVGQAVNQSGTAPTIQGQTAWFQWTPLLDNTATITVTSNNSGAYQFQPIIRIYAIPVGATALTIATIAPSTTYSVSPNDKTFNLAPSLSNKSVNNYAMSGIFQSTAILQATAGTTYLIQVDGVATNDFPNVGQGNFSISLSPNQTIASAPSFQPQSGWWYSPSYPGIGFAIETRTSKALLTPGAFLMGIMAYDANGQPTWGIVQGQLGYDSGTTSTTSMASYYSIAPNSQLATFNQYSGCGTLGSTASSTSMKPFGTPVQLTLRFYSSTTGQIEWGAPLTPLQILTGVTQPVLKIQRYAIPGSVPSAALPSTSTTTTTTTTLTPTTGWYWNLANATSYFIEEQPGALFMASFMCRPQSAGGTPTWYLTTNTISSTTSYLGRLFEYAGGTSLSALQTIGTSVPIAQTFDRGQVSMTLIAPTTTTTTQTTPGSAGTVTIGNVASPIARAVF
jgi:hypothetical protein